MPVNTIRIMLKSQKKKQKTRSSLTLQQLFLTQSLRSVSVLQRFASSAWLGRSNSSDISSIAVVGLCVVRGECAFELQVRTLSLG